jgi:uncharacterized repeat protein (TIGR01451 family)
MRQTLAATALLALLALGAAEARAAGTPAGTPISNKATASYTVGTTPLTRESNEVTTTVAELLDATLVWQDSGPVPVAPGATDQPLKFLFTNTGNGSEVYTLGVGPNQGGDQFDPATVALYLDNGDGSFGAGDTLLPGGILPALGADDAATVFVLSNIPGGLADGDLGIDLVSATAATGSGAQGTVLAGLGDGGVDAVIDAAGGLPVAASGSYVASSVSVTVAKTAAVSDPFGGDQPVPGATITYTLTVSIGGSGTALGLTITDPVPASTTYLPGTLTLNGAPLSDSSGNDAGEVGGTPPTVTVRLGDLATGAGNQVITFAVAID